MQQINLYLPEFRPSREPLRAVHMLWILVAIAAILGLFSIYTHSQHEKLLVELADAQQQQKTLQSQLQLLTQQKPVQAGINSDAKLLQLQHSLQRRQRILAAISSQHLGNQKGFSAQLTTLATASLNTISLETFSLQKGGTYAEFTGKARTADQIPLYLQKLRANESFANVGFGVLNVERDKKSNGLLSFSVAKTRPTTDVTKAASEKIRSAEQDAKTNELMRVFMQPAPDRNITAEGNR